MTWELGMAMASSSSSSRTTHGAVKRMDGVSSRYAEVPATDAVVTSHRHSRGAVGPSAPDSSVPLRLVCGSEQRQERRCHDNRPAACVVAKVTSSRPPKKTLPSCLLLSSPAWHRRTTLAWLFLLTLMACRPCHGHDPELLDIDDEDGKFFFVISMGGSCIPLYSFFYFTLRAQCAFTLYTYYTVDMELTLQ